jgi:hypothetical protein
MKKLTPAEMVKALRCCSTAGDNCTECPIYDDCENVNLYADAAYMIEELACKNEPVPVVYHAKIKGIGEAVETVQGIADKINAAISLADDLAAKLGSLKVDVE